jgi:hypothetical protein
VPAVLKQPKRNSRRSRADPPVIALLLATIWERPCDVLEIEQVQISNSSRSSENIATAGTRWSCAAVNGNDKVSAGNCCIEMAVGLVCRVGKL